MDGQLLGNGAGAPLSTAEPQAVQPVGDQGGATFAPPALDTAVPTETVSSTVPSTPQTQFSVDPTEYEQLVARNRQYEQAFNELRQLQAAAKQQAAEQQLHQQMQSRVDMAYRQAQNMEPEQALAYVRQVEDQERANALNMMRQIQQQAQQQTYQAVATVAAPLYAHQLAAQHGLPQEYAQRLAMLPDPHQMDAYLPVLKREHQQTEAQKKQYQELLQRFDQMQRSQQAAALENSGVTNVSSTTGVPITRNDGTYVPGSRQHLVARLGPLLGMSQ